MGQGLTFLSPSRYCSHDACTHSGPQVSGAQARERRRGRILASLLRRAQTLCNKNRLHSLVQAVRVATHNALTRKKEPRT